MMVTDNNETMKSATDTMWDCMAANVRTAVDAGQRVQKSMLSLAKEAYATPFGYRTVWERGECFGSECDTVVVKTLEAWGNSMGAAINAGLDMFRAACSVPTMSHSGGRHGFNESSQFWEAAVTAARTGCESLETATMASVEAFEYYCRPGRGHSDRGKGESGGRTKAAVSAS